MPSLSSVFGQSPDAEEFQNLDDWISKYLSLCKSKILQKNFLLSAFYFLEKKIQNLFQIAYCL